MQGVLGKFVSAQKYLHRNLSDIQSGEGCFERENLSRCLRSARELSKLAEVV